MAGAYAAAEAMFISSHDLVRPARRPARRGDRRRRRRRSSLGARVERASRSLGEVARRIGAARREPAGAARSRAPRSSTRLGGRARRDGARGSTRPSDASARSRRRAASSSAGCPTTSAPRSPASGPWPRRSRTASSTIPTTVERYHRRLREEADHLAALVDDLFELSRTQAGALRLEFSTRVARRPGLRRARRERAGRRGEGRAPRRADGRPAARDRGVGPRGAARAAQPARERDPPHPERRERRRRGRGRRRLGRAACSSRCATTAAASRRADLDAHLRHRLPGRPVAPARAAPASGSRSPRGSPTPTRASSPSATRTAAPASRCASRRCARHEGPRHRRAAGSSAPTSSSSSSTAATRWSSSTRSKPDAHRARPAAGSARRATASTASGDLDAMLDAVRGLRRGVPPGRQGRARRRLLATSIDVRPPQRPRHRDAAPRAARAATSAVGTCSRAAWWSTARARTTARRHGPVRPAAARARGARRPAGSNRPARSAGGRSRRVPIPEDAPLVPPERLRRDQAPPGAPRRGRSRWSTPTSPRPRCGTTTSTGRGCPATRRTRGSRASSAARSSAGEAPRVFEDGGQRRDFVHVADVARANVLALTRPGCRSPGPLNVASGTPHTILEMAEALADAAGAGGTAAAGRRRLAAGRRPPHRRLTGAGRRALGFTRRASTSRRACASSRRPSCGRDRTGRRRRRLGPGPRLPLPPARRGRRPRARGPRAGAARR